MLSRETHRALADRAEGHDDENGAAAAGSKRREEEEEDVPDDARTLAKRAKIEAIWQVGIRLTAFGLEPMARDIM